MTRLRDRTVRIVYFSCILVFFCFEARAYELKTGIALGPGIRTDAFENLDDVFFSLGLHASLLWGRDGDGHWAGGPHFFFISDDFSNVGAGIGGSVLFPVSDEYPFELSCGPMYRKDPGEKHSAGIAARLWWGMLKKNMQDIYSGSIGIFIESRIDVYGEEGRFFILGIEFDGLTILGPLWI